MKIKIDWGFGIGTLVLSICLFVFYSFRFIDRSGDKIESLRKRFQESTVITIDNDATRTVVMAVLSLVALMCVAFIIVLIYQYMKLKKAEAHENEKSAL